MAVKLNRGAVTFAQSLIDKGAYTEAPWSWDAKARQALFDSEGKDWSKFGRWFMGTDDSMDPETFGHYKYPIGKAGKVYERSLANIAARASANNAEDISKAASGLLDYIEDKESGESGDDSEGAGDDDMNSDEGKGLVSWHKRMEQVFSQARTNALKAEQKRDGIFTAIATTDQVDRQRERVIPEGIVNLKEYLRDNPVVLYAHNWMSLPIGRAVDARITKNTLEIDIEFAQTDAGQEIRYLYENKFLNAFSIGFLPVEMDEKSDMPTYTKWELLELSSVPIPANAGALAVRQAKKEGRELAVVKSMLSLESVTSAPKGEKSVAAQLKRAGVMRANSALKRM